ncbi:hypothetical protein OESDEN_10179 [Oesophagostomum dentatum]|uniref:Uncharacterized protein n=1 Tax=Oesophagostomum dentatum TaxID=61180 RepID=A0A0B1T3K5_OESDE|nr:hypothetical protein OESDEN_10179 [Oesophagostomum dentatum]
MAGDVFCGVEGGATESHLVFVNAGGILLGKSSTGGTNYNLDGIEKTATNIAVWIREAATASKIQLPLKGLVSAVLVVFHFQHNIWAHLPLSSCLLLFND